MSGDLLALSKLYLYSQWLQLKVSSPGKDCSIGFTKKEPSLITYFNIYEVNDLEMVKRALKTLLVKTILLCPYRTDTSESKRNSQQRLLSSRQD